MTSHTGLVGSLMLAASVALGAQSTPPPVNGTIALEGTTDKVYAALNVVIVQTIDGVRHVIHYTKDLLMHGGRSTGVEALEGLETGTTVVVHYSVTDTTETASEIDRVGDQGLKITEGIVARVDRGRERITIKFTNGTAEKFQLTARAAAEAGTDLGDVAQRGGNRAREPRPV